MYFNFDIICSASIHTHSVDARCLTTHLSPATPRSLFFHLLESSRRFANHLISKTNQGAGKQADCLEKKTSIHLYDKCATNISSISSVEYTYL